MAVPSGRLQAAVTAGGPRRRASQTIVDTEAVGPLMPVKVALG